MNKSRSENAAKQNSLINAIVVAIIVVFVAVGVYATYGKIADGIEEKAVVNGEKEATVEYLAKKAGISTEDFLAQYGLSLGDTITKDTTESEMVDQLSIENYLAYTGDTRTADELIEGVGLTDKVTKDTLWTEFIDLAPVGSVVGEEQFNAIKTQYNLGDDVTLDMPYGEFNKVMEDIIATQAGSGTTEAANDAEQTEQTDAQADGDTSGESAETAQEAPAAE